MIVRFVRADPEPMEIVAIAVRDSAVRPADVNSPDITFLL
jgi:hypothetical protein